MATNIIQGLVFITLPKIKFHHQLERIIAGYA